MVVWCIQTKSRLENPRGVSLFLLHMRKNGIVKLCRNTQQTAEPNTVFMFSYTLFETNYYAASRMCKIYGLIYFKIIINKLFLINPYIITHALTQTLNWLTALLYTIEMGICQD